MSDNLTKQGTDFVGDLVRAAQANPLSAGLLAMGVVWMFAGGGKISVSETFSRRPFQKAANSLLDNANNVSSGVGAVLKNTASGVSDATNSIATGVGEIIDSATSSLGGAAASGLDGVQAAREGIGRLARDAGQSAGSVSSFAVASTQKAGLQASSYLQQQVADVLDRQPSLIGIVGLAIGAGIAAAIPITAQENELMGKHSDTVREQAQSVISEKTEDIANAATRLAGG